MQYTNKDRLMVAIEMITYNHEKYIAQAIESVINQKTHYKYRLIICDDASNDKTQDICKRFELKFPDKIELHLNKVNKGVRLNAKKLHELSFNSSAKYIAMLDGDDYWCDKEKLQKQVDFLESNSDFSTCFTNAYKVKDQSLDVWKDRLPLIHESHPNETFLHEDLLKENRLITTTTIFRRRSEELPGWLQEVKLGDWALAVINSSYGKVRYLKDITAVYRFHENGIFSSLTFKRQLEDYIQTAQVLIKKFPLKSSIKDLKQGQKDRLLQLLNIFYQEKTSKKYATTLWAYFRFINSFNDLARIFKPTVKFFLLPFRKSVRH